MRPISNALIVLSARAFIFNNSNHVPTAGVRFVVQNYLNRILTALRELFNSTVIPLRQSMSIKNEFQVSVSSKKR